MTKASKPTPIKPGCAKKAVNSKHRASPRNAKGKEKGCEKEYWVVKPENGEAKWYGEELYAESYIASLKGTPCELKRFIIFDHALMEVNKHNNALMIANSKFLRKLKKDAGLDPYWEYDS